MSYLREVFGIEFFNEFLTTTAILLDIATFHSMLNIMANIVKLVKKLGSSSHIWRFSGRYGSIAVKSHGKPANLTVCSACSLKNEILTCEAGVEVEAEAEVQTEARYR